MPGTPGTPGTGTTAGGEGDSPGLPGAGDDGPGGGGDKGGISGDPRQAGDPGNGIRRTGDKRGRGKGKDGKNGADGKPGGDDQGRKGKKASKATGSSDGFLASGSRDVDSDPEGEPPPEKGGVPPDVTDGHDDDVVARQLREAAEKATDPELKEKLWEEYRAYKAGKSRGNTRDKTDDEGEGGDG
jgi:hypothetical protein